MADKRLAYLALLARSSCMLTVAFLYSRRKVRPACLMKKEKLSGQTSLVIKIKKYLRKLILYLPLYSFCNATNVKPEKSDGPAMPNAECQNKKLEKTIPERLCCYRVSSSSEHPTVLRAVA